MTPHSWLSSSNTAFSIYQDLIEEMCESQWNHSSVTRITIELSPFALGYLRMLESIN